MLSMRPPSILAREHDDLVHAPERDAREWKVGKRDTLAADDAAIAVVDDQAGLLGGLDHERPDLERLAGDAPVEGLRPGNLIEQPVGAAVLGDVLRALGIQHRLDDAMAVPLLGAVEVGELGVSEVIRAHVGLLWRGAHPAPMVVTRLCNTHRNAGGASTRKPPPFFCPPPPSLDRMCR